MHRQIVIELRVVNKSSGSLYCRRQIEFRRKDQREVARRVGHTKSIRYYWGRQGSTGQSRGSEDREPTFVRNHKCLQGSLKINFQSECPRESFIRRI